MGQSPQSPPGAAVPSGQVGALRRQGGLAQAQKAAGTGAALAHKGQRNTNQAQASLPSWEARGGEERAEAAPLDAVGHISPLPLAG